VEFTKELQNLQNNSTETGEMRVFRKKMIIFVTVLITNTKMSESKSYELEVDEDYRDFMRRLIAEQSDKEPLRIVEQLLEIAVGELRDRPYDLKAKATKQRVTVTLRHEGRPINERMIWMMGDHTDHVDYMPDGNMWELTIRRDIPPLFVTRRQTRFDR
jgi:hypothetical protein